MTTKEWLSRGWMIEKRIRKAEEQLSALRARAEAVKSSTPKAAPRGGRAKVWTDAVDAMCDEEARMAAEIAALYRTRDEIAGAVAAVSDVRLRCVLEYRYLCYMSWPRIAEMLSCDVRTVHRWHGRALRAVRVGPQKNCP